MVSGEFSSINGKHYRVEFYGAGDGELTIVGVTTSIATRDRKFVGYKSTTAQIQVLTDEPLVQFYTEDTLGIQVRIVADGTVEFLGYVTPFAFDQPYTGCADIVTIDCVDAITAAKDKPYRCVGDDVVDVTIEEIVRDIINYSGLDKEAYRMIVHANFDNNNSSERIFDAKIAQAGFIQDEMTALDAMNAVCLFFGYTCVLDGLTLVFFDEHCLLNAVKQYQRNVYVYVSSNGKLQSSKIYGDDSPFRIVDISDRVHNDISVTIERAYDAIQITPSGSDTSVILPDVCAAENIEDNTDGRGTEPILLDDPEALASGVISYSRPVQSKVMELRNGDTASAWDSPSQMTYGTKAFSAWGCGAMLLENRVYQKTGYNIVNSDDATADIKAIREESRRNLLWVRAFTGNNTSYIGRQIRKCSHTGGIISAEVNLMYAAKPTSAGVVGRYRAYSVEKGRLSLLQIKFGDDIYWNGDYTAGEDAIFSRNLCKNMYLREGDLIPTAAGDVNFSDRFIINVPTDSPISLDIKWGSGDYSVYYLNGGVRPVTGPSGHDGLLFTKLEIRGVGDEIPLDDAELRHEYKDNPKEVLEVDSPLTTRASNAKPSMSGTMYPLGVNARPAIVVGETWPCGGYMGSSRREMPICGILMTQLKARYGNPRMRYSMTCEGHIFPFATIKFLGKSYTVEGMERDLINDTTKITIN